MKKTMKRLTSILLVLTIIFSCFAFVGCAFWKETKSHTTTQKPRERNPKDDLILNYGAGFTEEDLDFVRFLHEKEFALTNPAVYDFSDLFKVFSGRDAICRVDIDLEQEPYFIAAYAIEQNGTIPFGLESGCLSDRMSWYKFFDYNTIPDEISGLVLYGVFAIYDCTIQRNVLTGALYNEKAKYYVPITKGYPEINCEFNYSLYDSVLWFESESIFRYDSTIIVQHRLGKTYLDNKDMFELYVNELGEECIVFNFFAHSVAECECTEEYIFEYLTSDGLDYLYDEMVPCFFRNKELDEYSEDGKYIRHKICIKLDDLLSIMKKYSWYNID